MDGIFLSSALLALGIAAPMGQDGSNDVADLVRRLDHEELAVREAAGQALLKAGARALPELEKALAHASPEVRGRATDLLNRLPEYALKFLLRHPELPALRRLWTATIETRVSMRPIPAAAWAEFGADFRQLQEEVDPQPLTKVPHTGAWLVTRLRDDGTAAFRSLGLSHGIEGDDDRVKQMAECIEHVRTAVQDEGLARLLKLDVDETAFEEIYVSLLWLQARLEGRWLEGLSGEDWDTVLRLLVRFRRAPDGPAMVPPAGPEEALKLVRRGPWMRGIASALGRAFAYEATEGPMAADEILAAHAPDEDLVKEPPSGATALRAVYDRLFLLEEEIRRCYFQEIALAPLTPALPDPKVRRIVDRQLLKRVCANADLDADTIRVVEAIVSSAHPAGALLEDRLVDLRLDDLTTALIRALAKEVVEAVRAAAPPNK